MVRGLDYSHNGKAYRFNVNTFSSEICLQGKPNGISLAEVVRDYFDFSEFTKYCRNCHYSNKFRSYVLPLENHLGEKNFVLIKNDKVFNPNKFVGFAVSDNITKCPYFISDIGYAVKNENWLYFSQPEKLLVDYIKTKYKCRPQFQERYNDRVLHLLSIVPTSWNYQSDNTLRVPNPTLEDRTILINLLPEEDYIEFEKEIIIILNSDNIGLLTNHCLTLYSNL